VLVGEHPNELVRDQYVMKLAGRLDIDPDRLRGVVSRAHSSSTAHVRPVSSATTDPPEHPVDRRELDALRWSVHAPSLVGGRLDVSLFADPVARSAFAALTAGTLEEALHHDDPQVAALLQRLAVEEAPAGATVEELVSRVVVNLAEASSQRRLASMLRSGDERSTQMKALLDALVRERDAGSWASAEEVAAKLVAWNAELSGFGGDDG
jgi:hypothetical protein